jgi:anti-sigma factor RsiW
MTTKKPSEPDAIAELAPFYVAGTLSADEAARFEAELARDPDLLRNVAAARAERDEVLALNETLPAPSPHALEKMLGLIDAEPARKPSLWSRLDIGSALADMFSPRALGWAVAAACLLVSVEAGILTLQPSPKPVDGYATASRSDTPAQGGVFALIAFAPKANAETVSALLAQTGVQIVEGPRAGGFYRIRLGGPDLPPVEVQRRLDALRQATAVVRFAEPSP